MREKLRKIKEMLIIIHYHNKIMQDVFNDKNFSLHEKVWMLENLNQSIKDSEKELALIDEIIADLDGEELVEKVTEAIINNKRNGMLGRDWHPENFEYGNIKAEAAAAIEAITGERENG